MTDLISIIVPVYNVENLVEKTLHSICTQTYKNLQILLINAGSTDGSLAICKDWEQKDSRIRVYTQQNSGVAAARNRGMELAEGKYLMFVDADDWIEPKMLETLHELAETYHADVAGCRLQEETPEKQRNTELSVNYENAEKKIAHYNTKAESGLALLLVWGVFCKLYRKELVNEIRFEQYKVAEDLLFNTTVICSDGFQSVVTTDYPFYHYVIYPGSAMKQSFQKKYLDSMQVEAQCYEKLSAISEKYTDINLIGCSVIRVFEKYAVLS